MTVDGSFRNCFKRCWMQVGGVGPELVWFQKPKRKRVLRGASACRYVTGPGQSSVRSAFTRAPAGKLMSREPVERTAAGLLLARHPNHR